ncbi:hypothetical protein Mapa_016830 [Marchantia paleacea]|nr:hypothetical protein Mapa_016830 [Marchantia paleacea]
MGNGTKFKLSSMFPSVLSKIKGMTGKRLKGKGALTNPSDWSGDLQDFSGASKDSPGSPPSPVRTFPQNRDRDMRYCSSPRCSSPVNHKSYDIRFPIESPVRRGMKSRPVSPPRRSANSTNSDSGCCSFDSSLALMPNDRARRAVPPLFGRCLQRSKCNSFNSETHSDSDLDITDSEPASARGHLRARTMSMQLDGATEWERERDWSEPEKSASSSRRRRTRETNKSTAGEPSPIHTVRCMPPNTPSDVGNYSDSRDMECHRSACPDFSREMSDHSHGHNLTGRQQQYERKLSFTTDDNRLFEDTYTSFSSDEDFFKVRSGYNAIGQYRLKKLNKYGNGDVTDAGYASGEVSLTEDEERNLRRESVLAKTVRNASDGWARVQSRFAEEEKHAQITRGGGGGPRRSYDRRAVVADESDILLTEDERHHAAMCRREASLVKTVLSAKDWARENLRALSKASEIEKQQQQAKLRGTDSVAEYESFGLPVIHKEHLHSRGGTRSHSPIGEVEKHTKGRIDYKSSPNDHQDVSDHLVYEQFSQPLAEYASDFYKNAQTEESDFETGVSVSRPWDVEFPSFRSDSIQLGGSRRSGPVELSESEGPTPRNHRYSVQERTSSAKTPRKQTPTSREPLGKKSGRSASPKVQESAPVNSLKPSSRSGSPRRQELHSGKRATSPRTPSSARPEALASKKTSRSPSPRQEVSGKKQQPPSNSINSPSPRQQQQPVEVSSNGSSKKANRSASPAHSPPETEKRDSNSRPSHQQQHQQQTRLQEERTSVMGSDSVAVVKASYDPYQDFRESMVEMILENDIQTAEDLEQLLQCYLSLNSAEYHSIIVQVFSDIWRDIFDH